MIDLPTDGKILVPVEIETFDVGRRVHQVDDGILARVGHNVRAKLLQQAGPRHYACVILAEGKGAFLPATPWLPQVPQEKKDFLRELTVTINRMAAGPGFWVSAWTDAADPRQFVNLWFDQDGDCQVAHESDPTNTFERLQRIGYDGFAEHCGVALLVWAEQMAKLELAEYQTVRAALGGLVP